MPQDDACLLDSNILLRISKSDDSHHGAISEALQTLAGRGARICYTSQTLGEFWNASTRPLDKNGFGLRAIAFGRAQFGAHKKTQGIQVHDARRECTSMVSSNS